MTNDYSGFVNLNKPLGWTSHDCVARLRKILRLKRIGHAGTLDPLAGGVLPIAVGKATRLLQYLRPEKAYTATIRLGVQTTTDDLEGEIIASRPCQELSLATVKTALTQFQGTIQQIPPSYSAIQVQGKRLYDLARKGEIVTAPERTVEISQLEVLDWRTGDFPEVDVAIACGAGTYIRAIARDLGATLETGGTLSKLTRTQSSGFDLQSSLTFDQITEQLETFQPVAPDTALQHLKAIYLPLVDAQKWCQGQRVAVSEPICGLVRVYDESQRFLGIAQAEEAVLIPTMVFAAI